MPPSSINPNFGKRYSSKRSPLQAITTRAAQRFIRQGDDGKLCAFADLYEARECMPKELFDELDQEYSAWASSSSVLVRHTDAPRIA